MIVETINSAYLFDWDAGTVTRCTHWGEPLRKDDEAVPFLALVPPVIGEPMRMLIKLTDEGYTLRTTTEVVSIKYEPT